jgi:phage baseplate assembly protein W
MASSAINFKSIGKSTISVKENIVSEQIAIPIGIRTPLRYGNKSLFEMNDDLFDQIRDNLKNLIMTNHGERLVFFDFGANLSELSTERISREDYDQEVASRIAAAVAKWMSFVSLDELVPSDNEQDINRHNEVAVIPIRRYLLTYSVPSIGSPQQSLEVIVGLT